MIILSILVQRRKNAVGKEILALLFISTAAYTLGYAMELISVDLSEKIYWNLIQYAGLPFIGSFWLLYSIEYVGKGYLLTKGVIASALIFPVLVITLRYTNSLHKLFYTDLQLIWNGNYFNMVIKRGSLYFILVFHQLANMILSLYFYSLSLRNSMGKINIQSLYMFIASFIPVIAIMTNCLIPEMMDIGPLILIISFCLLIFGIKRYQMLNIIPIVRDKVFELTHDGIIVLDGLYRILDYNPPAVTIFRELSKKSIGHAVGEALKDYPDVINAIMNTDTTHRLNIDVRGKPKCYSMNNYPIMHRNDITGHLVILNDITDYMKAIRDMDILASIDGLTGVLNRRSFIKKANKEIVKARSLSEPVTILMLDIDEFKAINDTQGHSAGDKALMTIGEICREQTRPTDIIGRLGGEEFSILLPGTNKEDGINIAERLRKVIYNTTIENDGSTFSVTVSIGVECICAGSETVDIESMLKRVDEVLYRAKREGRNRVEYLSTS